MNSYERNGYGLYKILLKDIKEPIGICGLVKRPYLNHPDIGFALLPQYEGKGFALEAAKAILNVATARLKLYPVLAITTLQNTKSQRLLNKIGLFKIGEIKPPKEETPLLLFSNKTDK